MLSNPPFCYFHSKTHSVCSSPGITLCLARRPFLFFFPLFFIFSLCRCVCSVYLFIVRSPWHIRTIVLLCFFFAPPLFFSVWIPCRFHFLLFVFYSTLLYINTCYISTRSWFLFFNFISLYINTYYIIIHDELLFWFIWKKKWFQIMSLPLC